MTVSACCIAKLPLGSYLVQHHRQLGETALKWYAATDTAVKQHHTCNLSQHTVVV